MRISTTQFNQSSVTQMLTQQSQLNRTQMKLASGKELLQPADGPVEFAKTFLLNTELSRITQFNTNIQVAQYDLNLQENTLNTAATMLVRVRELTVQARSPAIAADDRLSISHEMNEIINEMVNLANTKNAEGQYIYAGFSNGTVPITLNSSQEYDYQGDAGQRFVQIGQTTRLPVSNTAKNIFMDISAGPASVAVQPKPNNAGAMNIANVAVTTPATWQAALNDKYTLTFNPLSPGANYTVTANSAPGVPLPGLNNVSFTSGDTINIEGVSFTLAGTPQPGDSLVVGQANQQSMFQTLQNLSNAISTLGGTGNAARMDFEFDLGLQNLNNIEDHIASQRTEIGARLNMLDHEQGLNDSVLMNTQATLAKIMDVDPIAAISQLTEQRQLLEVAEMSLARISGMSLFNYIR